MPVHLGRPQRRGVRPGRPCTQATLARGLPTAKHPDFVKVCACHSRQATRPSEAHADRLPWQGACLATRHLGRTQISPTCRHFASSFCCCTFCRCKLRLCPTTSWPGWSCSPAPSCKPPTAGYSWLSAASARFRNSNRTVFSEQGKKETSLACLRQSRFPRKWAVSTYFVFSHILGHTSSCRSAGAPSVKRLQPAAAAVGFKEIPGWVYGACTHLHKLSSNMGIDLKIYDHRKWDNVHSDQFKICKCELKSSSNIKSICLQRGDGGVWYAWHREGEFLEDGNRAEGEKARKGEISWMNVDECHLPI